jgi:Fe-S-cluster-containing hydrogenase component 2
MVVRKIVRIDERLCDGCGLCVTPCAEAAIEIVDGKAKVVREELCDGAGFCLAVCPSGALTIEERETADFDEAAVREHRREAAKPNADRGPTTGAAARIRCELCGVGEEDTTLIACRNQGRSIWVCVRCLPSLIHG